MRALPGPTVNGLSGFALPTNPPQPSAADDCGECEGCLGPLTDAEAKTARSTGFLICTACLEALAETGARDSL